MKHVCKYCGSQLDYVSAVPNSGGAQLKAFTTDRSVRKWAGYSVVEAARVLGQTEYGFRRHLERHRVAEGDEMVVRLAGGVVARKRNGQARWVITIPAEMIEAS